MGRPKVDPVEVFWKHIHVEDNGCWRWTRPLQRGYGHISVNRRPYSVHRFAYELLVDRIGDGMQIDHQCHNEDASCPGGETCLHRACVNPNHLRQATPRQNVLSGKTVTGRNAVKTECKKGHPLYGDNLLINTNGERQCRKCRSTRQRRYRNTDEYRIEDARRHREARSRLREAS